MRAGKNNNVSYQVYQRGRDIAPPLLPRGCILLRAPRAVREMAGIATPIARFRRGASSGGRTPS